MDVRVTKNPLKILLADDDLDDRFFFGKALSELPFETRIATVKNGEQLMDYLHTDTNALPDVIFLDLNMPRKNGFECLEEIKSDERLKSVPVLIYSTSLNNTVADVLYQKGAHYYIQKNVSDLTKDLRLMFNLLENKKYKRPLRDSFVIDFVDEHFREAKKIVK